MAKIFLSLFLLISGFIANAQSANPKYDKALAEALGGDDYGMKMYVLVILKSGTVEVTEKAVRDSLFQGHMKNIMRLADLKKLVVAGPLGKNDKNYRGIFILNASLEEAKELLDTDPAIKAKLFDTELFPWYGSAALSEYLKYHEKIEKKTF